MAIELPACLQALSDFLTQSAGFSKEAELVEKTGFENICVFLGNGNLRVRLVRERSDWRVDFDELTAPEEWYDIALIRYVIDGASTDEIMSVDQEANYLLTRWSAIRRAFQSEEAARTHKAIQRERHERYRRRFPECAG